MAMGNGKDGTKAVNDVEAEDQRNVQPRFFNSEMLVVIDLGWIRNKKQRSQLAFGNGIVNRTRRAEGKQLIQLAELLFQSHLLEQRVGTLVNCSLVRRSGGRRCLRRGNRNEGEREEKEQRAAEILFVEPELLVCFHDNLPQDGVMLIGARQRCQKKIEKKRFTWSLCEHRYAQLQVSRSLEIGTERT